MRVKKDPHLRIFLYINKRRFLGRKTKLVLLNNDYTLLLMCYWVLYKTLVQYETINCVKYYILDLECCLAYVL